MQPLLHDSKSGLTDRSIFRSACFLILLYVPPLFTSLWITVVCILSLKDMLNLFVRIMWMGLSNCQWLTVLIYPYYAKSFGAWCSTGQIFITRLSDIGNFVERGDSEFGGIGILEAHCILGTTYEGQSPSFPLLWPYHILSWFDKYTVLLLGW